MGIAKAAIVYGVTGFAAGFVFGTLRELLLIPAFGGTAGRWIEFVPLIGVIAILGWWIAVRAVLRRTIPALICGVAGVAVLLVLESGFALGVLGQTPEEYLASFDVTAGALFPFGLAFMAVAPALAVWLTAGRNQ